MMMTPRRLFCFCAALTGLLCAPALATDLSGYLSLTSDYVKRGVTQSDGDPAVQLGLEVGFDNGFYGGAWGSTADIRNGPTRRREREVNVYAGYEYDASDTWRLSAGVVSYTYPAQKGDIDYDYVEYSVGASFDDRFWLQYSYSPDLYSSGLSTENVDVYFEWPAGRTWTLGGGGGYYDTSNFTGHGYWYTQLGATASFRHVDLDLRFHDTNRWVPVVSSPGRADARIALTIRIPF